MLRSLITTEKEKLPYWFDERHKCWLRLSVKRSDLTSRKRIIVRIPGNEELLDFHSDREIWVNKNDIEFFNINPNDNLCLNVEYYKSLHWYKWDVLLSHRERPNGYLITNKTQRDVFDF